MNDKPLCSLIIRCFNEEQHIGRLLSGVMAQSVKNVEIIIVDSGSTDATLSIAERYPVKILSIRPDQFSFGRSLNIGCAAASGEFLVMASAHVYPVFLDWLEKLLEPFSDPYIALVYGKQRGDQSAKFTEQQIYKKWFPDYSINPQKHPFCNNANAAIRRDLWQKLPYNEEITGLEDLEWAKRVVELGGKIAYNSDAEIIHVHRESLRQIYNRYRRESIAFLKIYPFEKFNLLDFFRLYFANVVTDLCHALRDRVIVKSFRSIFAFRFMQFWGTYRGFRQRGSVSEDLKNRFYYPNGLFSSQRPGAVTAEQDRRINYDHH